MEQPMLPPSCDVDYCSNKRKPKQQKQWLPRRVEVAHIKSIRIHKSLSEYPRPEHRVGIRTSSSSSGIGSSTCCRYCCCSSRRSSSSSKVEKVVVVVVVVQAVARASVVVVTVVVVVAATLVVVEQCRILCDVHLPCCRPRCANLTTVHIVPK